MMSLINDVKMFTYWMQGKKRFQPPNRTLAHASDRNVETL
jgi:hypothetical protein